MPDRCTQFPGISNLLTRGASPPRKAIMTEMQGALSLLRGEFPTCVQGPIDYPIHQGKPNPSHGKYYFVGRIPGACYDQEKKCSKKYDTEELAIQAAIDAGATRIQDSHCKFVLGQ